MAELFRKQAKNYAAARPRYPAELFQFIVSKTPRHLMAWDVATGNGQAAASVAGIYETVIATDVSSEQLSHAIQIPNVRYRWTPPSISMDELQTYVAAPGTLDLITVAQAVHWFDLPQFYSLARAALRQPGGVIAVWCYSIPRVDDRFDQVFDRFYSSMEEYWAPELKMVEDGYRDLEFPFDPVEEEETTGPFRFEARREITLDGLMDFIRSWSAYQTALAKEVDFLDEAAGGGELRRAWGEDAAKTVTYPIHLRIGRV